MQGNYWLDNETFDGGMVGLSDATLMIDQLRRKALRHWNQTITSERAGLRGQFRYLAAWWKHDTEFQSSTSRVAMHPAYKRIIEMGREVLPLILGDLKATQAPWFWALQTITGEDPLPVDDRGYIDRMTQAWVN
jgi:hypothetical protein